MKDGPTEKARLARRLRQQIPALRQQVAALRANEAIVRVATNSGWLLGDRILRAAASFVVGALVARYLGPERFGHFAYVLALMAFFQAVAPLGADGIAVAAVARHPESAGRVLGSLVRMRLLCGLVCWPTAVAVMALLSPHDSEAIAMTVMVGSVLVLQACDTIDLWFQSQGENRRTVKAKIVAFAVTSGFKVVLVMAGAPLWAFAGAFALDFALAAAALVVAYRGLPTPGGWRFDPSEARDLLVQTWPFLLSALSIVVYVRIDQIMLQQLRGSHEAGIYAAALPLSQIWQMIPVTLALSLAPMIARRKAAGEAAYEVALLHIFRLFAAISIGVAGVTYLAAPILIPLIYGPVYSPSIAVLRIHVFTNVFVALGVAQGLWIINERKGWMILVKTLAGATIAVVGNLIAIPMWGAVGAACVAVIAQAVASVFSNVFFARRIFLMQLGISPWNTKSPITET